MSHWFQHGDMPGFFGFHILFAIGFFLMWLVLVAGAFVLLYLVIRMAVTRGILRADALRAAPAGHAVAHPVASAPPATPTPQPASPTAQPATPAQPATSTGKPVSPFERRADPADDTDPSI